MEELTDLEETFCGIDDGEIRCCSHSYTFRAGDLIYKSYIMAPAIPGRFPFVSLENIGVFEKRVWSILKDDGFQVPEEFEDVSRDEIIGALENVSQSQRYWKPLLKHLLDNPAVAANKRSILPSFELPPFYNPTIQNELEMLELFGFSMGDFVRDSEYRNLVLNSDGIGFYDFKSFFPETEEMKDAFKDLILPEPSISQLLARGNPYTR